MTKPELNIEILAPEEVKRLESTIITPGLGIGPDDEDGLIVELQYSSKESETCPNQPILKVSWQGIHRTPFGLEVNGQIIASAQHNNFYDLEGNIIGSYRRLSDTTEKREMLILW